MPRDLRRLLDDTAASPTRPVDPAQIVTRARRRTWAVRIAVSVVAILAVVGAALGAQQVFDTTQPPEIVDQPTGDPEATASPDDRPSPTSSPTGLPPATAVFPGTVIASTPGLVEIDPATGRVVRQVTGPVGEGSVHLSVTPDGTAVYHEQLWTGCATRIHRTSLEAGDSQLLDNGLLPAVSPDATTLAYVSYQPCVFEGHELVLQDLSNGQQTHVGLAQPDDELARIEGLAWAADNRQLAVEISYTPREDGNIGPPARYDLHIVDTAQLPDTVGATPQIDEGDHSVEWRLGGYTDRQTLLVVEWCCDLQASGGALHDDVDTSRLLEIDVTTGDIVDTLAESNSPITDVTTDATGNHILYVETRPKDPGTDPQRDVLKAISDGHPYTITDGVARADWRPTQPEAATSTSYPPGQILSRPGPIPAEATSSTPAAGICPRPDTSDPLVTITVGPDTPVPRCVQVTGDQQLRIVNGTAAFQAAQATTFTAELGGWTFRLEPGQALTLDMPVSTYLEQGVHSIESDYRPAGAEVWVQPPAARPSPGPAP